MQFERLAAAVILVVEDDALVQLELADWLTNLGLTVLTADNAEEGLTLLDARPDIEFLMTDIQLPGTLDGIKLAHHVAERWPPIKILVVSGMFKTELAVLPAGSHFFPKPFNRQHLWQVLSGSDLPDAPIAPPAHHRPRPRSERA